MREQTKSEHPFASEHGGIYCDVESRVYKIKQSTDAAWLERVLRCDDLQITVRVAAQRKLRKLLKAQYEGGK